MKQFHPYYASIRFDNTDQNCKMGYLCLSRQMGCEYSHQSTCTCRRVFIAASLTMSEN